MYLSNYFKISLKIKLCNDWGLRVDARNTSQTLFDFQFRTAGSDNAGNIGLV